MHESSEIECRLDKMRKIHLCFLCAYLKLKDLHKRNCRQSWVLRLESVWWWRLMSAVRLAACLQPSVRSERNLTAHKAIALQTAHTALNQCMSIMSWQAARTGLWTLLVAQQMLLTYCSVIAGGSHWSNHGLSVLPLLRVIQRLCSNEILSQSLQLTGHPSGTRVQVL